MNNIDSADQLARQVMEVDYFDADQNGEILDNNNHQGSANQENLVD